MSISMTLFQRDDGQWCAHVKGPPPSLARLFEDPVALELEVRFPDGVQYARIPQGGETMTLLSPAADHG